MLRVASSTQRSNHLRYAVLLLTLGIALSSSGYALTEEGDVAWQHRVERNGIALMASALGRHSREAFYEARGFSAAMIRPYALACGFSVGVQNAGNAVITTRLIDWYAVGADGAKVGIAQPEAWDADWDKSGVSQPARIAFRWAQFQSENTFEPGDWIMGMMTLETVPSAPFRLTVRYRANHAEHEIVLDKLECARD